MDKVFVDTNIFLRFLTNDDPTKAARVEAFFQKAVGGKVQLTTSLIVIAEIVWTLESYYGLEKSDIESKVTKILNTPNLEVEREDLLISALDLYASRNIDFIDAYNAFYMKDNDIDRILTYDKKHFSRVDWLERAEP
ncbi:MAG: type II toxin-antitoxin system VapC family toxin [Candidatus Manganitrophaceae bacterium]